LIEVVLELLGSQFKIKAANKDFRFGISKLDLLFIGDLTFFRFDQDVRVGFLDLLATCGSDCLVPLIWLEGILAATFLIIIS
jgi:hypothetical protein